MANMEENKIKYFKRENEYYIKTLSYIKSVSGEETVFVKTTFADESISYEVASCHLVDHDWQEVDKVEFDLFRKEFSDHLNSI